MNNVAEVAGASCLYAEIIRADGRHERPRLIAYHHPNLFRRGFIRLLMKLGVL